MKKIQPDDEGGSPADAVALAYPNPGNKKISIKIHTAREAQVQVVIINIAGKRIGEINVRVRPPAEILEWHCEHIASGLYYALIRQEGKNSARVKIAIKH